MLKRKQKSLDSEKEKEKRNRQCQENHILAGFLKRISALLRSLILHIGH